MSIDIDNLTEVELVELNHRIVERLKFLDSMHAHKEMMHFNRGEQVSFEPADRGRQVGTLVKFNKKTVTVITESGQRWNVPPSMLNKVKNVKSSGNKSGKIIELPREK